MFLACIELENQGDADQLGRARVLQLKFNHLETAKVWAQEESSRRGDATGNAAVFEQMGPYLSLAWEHDAVRYGADAVEAPRFTADQLAEPA